MIKRTIQASLILFAFLLSTACQTLLSFSPDRAAVQEIVLNSPAMIEVHRDTIRVLQMQEYDQGTLVLATYLANMGEGQLSECLALIYSQKGLEGWNASSRGSGCWPAELVEDEKPIQVLSGQSRSGAHSSSDASGLVYDPEIKTIQLTWKDGETQVLEVVKASFLSVRTGMHDLQSVTAIDASGELVYSLEIPPPAPGKEG
jgi:hypothetical protein